MIPEDVAYEPYDERYEDEDEDQGPVDEDVLRERKADGDRPLPVDRNVLREIIEEKMHVEVDNMVFLSSGTFHKAFLINLKPSSDTSKPKELIARIARRFMPYIKTESEVATMAYLRNNTPIPVPEVFHHDSNPLNRLGLEYILMSKAPGVPASTLPPILPREFITSLATLLSSLSTHRFPSIGSLYDRGTHVGPIVSWPFFGSFRGEDSTIDRGPWGSTEEYLRACMEREVRAVVKENEGKIRGHRPKMDPEFHASLSDAEEDELEAGGTSTGGGGTGGVGSGWDSASDTGSEEDAFYRDYRSQQRSTYLVAHMNAREEAVRGEMEALMRYYEQVGVREMDREARESDPSGKGHAFGLDCHDLSRENVFVDPNDCSKITCIIDWESTTIRPLWATAHLPSLIYTYHHSQPEHHYHLGYTPHHTHPSTPSPHPALLNAQALREEMTKLSASGGKEWLKWETEGEKLRRAHRALEWDGWEEGIVTSVLGDGFFEPDDSQAVNGVEDGGYFGNVVMGEGGRVFAAPPINVNGGGVPQAMPLVEAPAPAPLQVSGGVGVGVGVGGTRGFVGVIPEGADQPVAAVPAAVVNGAIVVGGGGGGTLMKSAMKKRHLDSHGDECEGVGGELGRRLGELVLSQADDTGDSSGTNSPFVGSPSATGAAIKIGRRRVLAFEDDEDVEGAGFDGGGHTDGVGGMKSFREFSTSEVGVGA